MHKVNPERIGLSSNKLNQINELIAKYINEKKIPGAITLVARGNQLAHFECAGRMNLEENKLMQENTIFRLYSMTKPVTSVAMMMLWERGYGVKYTPYHYSKINLSNVYT